MGQPFEITAYTAYRRRYVTPADLDPDGQIIIDIMDNTGSLLELGQGVQLRGIIFYNSGIPAYPDPELDMIYGNLGILVTTAPGETGTLVHMAEGLPQIEGFSGDHWRFYVRGREADYGPVPGEIGRIIFDPELECWSVYSDPYVVVEPAHWANPLPVGQRDALDRLAARDHERLIALPSLASLAIGSAKYQVYFGASVTVEEFAIVVNTALPALTGATVKLVKNGADVPNAEIEIDALTPAGTVLSVPLDDVTLSTGDVVGVVVSGGLGGLLLAELSVTPSLRVLAMA